MPEDRMSDYLDALDAAADWQPFDALILDGIAPASFQEWNQRRVADGLPAGTFTEYLSEMYPRRGDGEQESND